MRVLARRICFCGEVPSNKWYIIIIFRLYSNVLCRYNDNELVSHPQDRQFSKCFCSGPKCVLK